jgi:hypothetical protein
MLKNKTWLVVVVITNAPDAKTDDKSYILMLCQPLQRDSNPTLCVFSHTYKASRKYPLTLPKLDTPELQYEESFCLPCYSRKPAATEAS